MDDDTEAPIPLRKFEKQEDIAEIVKNFAIRLDELMVHCFGDQVSNIILSNNLLWDVQIKQDDKYVDSTYGLGTRPNDPAAVERLVEELIMRDPLLVECLITKFSKIFFDMYLLSSKTDKVLAAKIEESKTVSEETVLKPKLRLIKNEDEVN